ncbi:peptide chain release factor N(5)-glutamine methyltransferase [Limimaricola pyoseonensis]|uniref:Release factor glutamine methyltransferase n=1 Tax=Limimaricola pyoseonensis TaxID=521013 RepID=A0A1G7AQ70_9RHOB|nr:peptide chain release factor N(5)-glutamine methyltransferase [Limimaricola pyoseonensis]SDE17028.1 [protein release factor]-glutamine N5-methyltransferase [Limimaricola pyoseonensis]
MTDLPTGPLTGSVALYRATHVLAEAGVTDPGRDARRLLAHALRIDPGRLALVLPEPVDGAGLAEFDALVARRARREPVSHLTGSRAFYGRRFKVTSDVLDPRPETEILVEAALSGPFGHVLDLGTGSGCILLTLLAEMPDARGVGVDLSEAACAVARENAEALGLSHRARILVSDWVARVEGAFDLVVSNPPYIAEAEMPDLAPEVRDWEPRGALTDGADGLTAYRAILDGAMEVLAPRGRLLMELGVGQAATVSELAAARGYAPVALVPDLDGRPRVIVLERPAAAF